MTRARPRQRAWPGVVGWGLAAGLLAALAMTVVILILRLAAGVSLPVELGSDRVIPMLPVRTFTRLLGRLGGPLEAKQKAYVGGFVLQLLVGTVAGAAFALVLSRLGSPRGRRGLVAGVLALAWVVALVLLWPSLASSYRGLPTTWATVVTAIGLLLAFEAYAVVMVEAFERLSAGRSSSRAPQSYEEGEASGVPRRALLAAGLGAAMAVIAGGLSWSLDRRGTFGSNAYDGLQLRGPRTAPITPANRFYVVTKNLVDPDVDGSLWRLDIAGLVDRPESYSLEDLRRERAVRQVQTLECISNRVGSGLISNAEWTGVPLASLLEDAGPRPGVRRVSMHAADGYVHTVSMEQAMAPTTLVAFEMNGAPLPPRHGFPARVLVPGTYGEVNVKWVDRIELTDREVEGYYERQGWRPYHVSTTSRFDRPSSGAIVHAAAPLSLGGVAFAGDRGIARVEWSPDGGSTWSPGRITYAPSPLAWALWEATWTPAEPGTATLVVRATDGHGESQPTEPRGAVPAGATGLHRVRVTVR